MARGISTSQIQAFRLVMLRGTMTAAAEELGTSQPSISRLIKELERTTGLTLFLRKNGRLQATSAALAFHREVELSFVGLDKLLQSARDIACFGTGRLRIVSAPIMAVSVLPAVIGEFKRQRPRALITFEMRSGMTIQRWTSSGYCDLGFSTVVLDTLGLRVEPLYSVPGMCAMPVNHPLAEKTEIGVEDIVNYPLIVPSYADITRHPLEEAFRQAGVDLTSSVETPYGVTICALVSEGAGVGIVNPLAALKSNDRNITFRPFVPDVMYKGYMVLQESGWTNPLVKLFFQLTRTHIGGMLSRIRGGGISVR